MKPKKEVVVVFDSGVGGLTVLSEIKKRNIRESFVYLADSENSPYGDKSKEEIILFVLQSFMRLNKIYDFKSIIIACNTASAHTKELLEHIYKVPVYSVIDAAAKYLSDMDYKSADVLATTLTARSHAYQNSLPKMKMNEIGCPSFVPFIESDMYHKLFEREQLVARELTNKTGKDSDVIILGCTHYPLLEEEIRLFYGPESRIVNPSLLLAEKVAMDFNDSKEHCFDSKFYLTSKNPHFISFAKGLLNEDIVVELLTEETNVPNTNYKQIFIL